MSITLTAKTSRPLSNGISGLEPPVRKLVAVAESGPIVKDSPALKVPSIGLSKLNVPEPGVPLIAAMVAVPPLSPTITSPTSKSAVVPA